MSDILVTGPLSRRELYLAKIAGMDVAMPEPTTREEMYLAKLAGMDVTIPTPSSRAEMYLAAAAGDDVVLPDPVSREELFFAKMAGMDVITPEPESRCEVYLAAAAGGSGINYNLDALANVTWTDGYYYLNGELTEKANEHCTSKFTLQNCLYQLNYSGCLYPTLYIWDKEGNYIGQVENQHRQSGLPIHFQSFPGNQFQSSECQHRPCQQC